MKIELMILKMFSISLLLCLRLNVSLPIHKIQKYQKRFGLEKSMLLRLKPTSILSDPIISIGAGVTGMMILVFNRFSLIDVVVTDIQSRADIVAVLACSALMLNALSNQDIETRNRDPVSLVGIAVNGVVVNNNLFMNQTVKTMKLVSEAILQETPCKSMIVIWEDRVVGFSGVVSPSVNNNTLGFKLPLETMPILSKALKSTEEVYLPDLQILPGKIEFGYFPINTQSLLLIPFPNSKGAIVLGTNQAKIIRNRDTARVRLLSQLLYMELSK